MLMPLFALGSGMSLVIQLTIGTFMIGVTVFMHAIGLDFIMRHAKRLETRLQSMVGGMWRPMMSALIVISVFSLHVVQIWLWAVLYLGLECHPINDLATALSFSTLAYTTMGYGDIIPEKSWRMLSGVEGANGFLLFGWTTAFIFEVITQFYRRAATALED